MLDVIFKASKYMMDTDPRVITSSNFSKGTSYNEMKEPSTLLNYSDDIRGINNIVYSDTFWIVIRHNLVNCIDISMSTTCSGFSIC
jgi:hypothetical protein